MFSQYFRAMIIASLLAALPACDLIRTAKSKAKRQPLHSLDAGSGVTCPTTATGAREFRSKLARKIADDTAKLFSDPRNDSKQDTLQQTLRDTTRMVDRCEARRSSTSAKNDGKEICFDRLRSYAKTAGALGLKGHGLGFSVTDAQYLKETAEITQIPEPLQTQAFLRLVSRPEPLSDAKAYIDRLNRNRPDDEKMVYVSYTSQHLPTPDDTGTMGRLLIVVPGNPERWVQFGVAPIGGSVRSVSVVASLLAADGHRDTYFGDYYRIYGKDGKITIATRYSQGGGSDPCVKCHKSGLAPIFPLPGSVLPNEQANIGKVNARVRAYESPRFGGYEQTELLGPGLGDDSLARNAKRTSDAFMRRCVGSAMNRFANPAVSIRRISESMTCAKCHDADGLGAINAPFNKTLVRSYIVGGKMPPRSDLTTDEREALYSCLVADYFDRSKDAPGVLMTWLSQDSCANHNMSAE